jgi:hypothetical protein
VGFVVCRHCERGFFRLEDWHEHCSPECRHQANYKKRSRLAFAAEQVRFRPQPALAELADYA